MWKVPLIAPGCCAVVAPQTSPVRLPRTGMRHGTTGALYPGAFNYRCSLRLKECSDATSKLQFSFLLSHSSAFHLALCQTN